MGLKRFWGWLAANRTAARDWTVAVGAIAIPVTIYVGQGWATNQHEKSSRLVGITQLLSSTYSKECKEQWDTYQLVKQVFPKTFDPKHDDAFVPFLNKLALDANKNIHCPAAVKAIAIKEAAAANQESKKDFSDLKGFEIDIFYLQDNADLASKAVAISEALGKDLPDTKIVTKGKDRNYFNNLKIRDNNQIRYHQASEEKVASLLLGILAESKGNGFKLHTYPLYRDKSPDYLSIFIVK